MVKVSVYLDDANVWSYNVSNIFKGREHAAAIIKSGFRHTPEGTNDMEWFPPHRVIKVRVEGGGESSRYRDEGRAT